MDHAGECGKERQQSLVFMEQKFCGKFKATNLNPSSIDSETPKENSDIELKALQIENESLFKRVC